MLDLQGVRSSQTDELGGNFGLVFVYFLNDPDLDGPKTEREWRAAIKVMHEPWGFEVPRLRR